jgi:hypothetical protein
MAQLSLIIPSRNEQWLAATVQDALAHLRGDTDIWVALDGPTAHAPVPDDPRVHVQSYPAPIGQRAASNRLVEATSAPWVMKVDAHCSFAEGFDVALLAAVQPTFTIVPVMRNLHVFNWVCPQGHMRYQSPSGPCSGYWMCPNGHQRPDAGTGKCKECGQATVRHEGCGQPTELKVMWIPKSNPASRSYRFDSEPHFQYFNEWSKLPEGKGTLTETMSLQGSAFMLSRQRWLDLNICDESWGSWGSQGIEVACKSWLSGGSVVCCQNTWYAHCFRTQGGDFSFPYTMSAEQQEYAKRRAREVFFGNLWPQQVRPLSWLIDKFKPIPGWHLPDKNTTAEQAALILGQINAAGRAWEAAHGRPAPDLPALERRPSRGLAYYTDGQLDPALAEPVRARLSQIAAAKSLPIVTAALGPRLKLGIKNIIFPSLKRGHLTMFKQILAAVTHCPSEFVFFCEHDVLYHPSHFDFLPPRRDTFYYNTNVWQVRVPDGHAIYYFCRKLSQMCCARELAIDHFTRKIALVEANGGKYDAAMGFEPGTRGINKGGIDDLPCADWRSLVCNVDLRHPGTLSKSKWSLADFRHLPDDVDWHEADEVPGWGTLADFLPLVVSP